MTPEDTPVFRFAISSFANQIVQSEKLYIENVNDFSPGGIKKFIIKVGNLNSVRTYAHISDAVHAYWLAATKGKIGEVYNIGGNHTCTVGEALENLLNKSIIPRDKFDIVIDQDRIRPTDITLQIPNCDKFKKDTCWQSTKTLDDITTDLLNFWRETI